MASAARQAPPPRYGSAAELASYAGLSVKTIRRLVDAGAVRGLKVGRRLLIPFEDLDRHILKIEDERRPAMATAPQVASPYRSVDVHGRALPLTADEARRRAEEGIRALDALDDMGDEEEQRRTFEALKEGIDEDRLSYRKRFR